MQSTRNWLDWVTFLKKEKPHWLAIGAVLLLLIAFLLVFAEGGIGPFIYSAF